MRIVLYLVMLCEKMYQPTYIFTLTVFAHIPCNTFGIDDKCLSKSDIFSKNFEFAGLDITIKEHTLWPYYINNTKEMYWYFSL